MFVSPPDDPDHVPSCQAELIARYLHLLTASSPLVGDQTLHICSILGRLVRVESVAFSLVDQHHLFGFSPGSTGGDTFESEFFGWWQILIMEKVKSDTFESKPPETAVGAEVVAVALEADNSSPVQRYI